MNHISRLALAAAVFGLLVKNSSVQGQTPPAPGPWQLQFEDNFSGSTLDGSKWRLGAHTPGLAGQAGMAPENVTVSDGKLKIKAEQRSVTYSGNTKSYASGEVSTFLNFRQQYGYYEARIKCPAVTGLWPAFWLMPDRGAYGYRDIYARSYVKFDLTGANPGTITSAQLKMKVSAVESLLSGQNNNVLFMKLHNDSWTESALTWNNKPVPDPAWIAQRWNQAVAGQDMVVDVKDYITEEMAGDKVVSFAMADSFMLTKYIKFYSSEAANAADRPRLVINGTTYYASEDATVRWGTLANSNYGNAGELIVEDAWDDTASTYDGGMEVDIMESLGVWGPNVTSHAMHWDGYATGHPAAGSGKINYSASSDGFHVFGLYWGAGKLAFYIDGVKTHEWVNARVATVPAYLLLSLQLGGWDGNTPGAQVNNQVMEVDWVRVWSGDPFIPSAVTVDNTDSASVSAVGSWTAAGGVPGYLGSNYQHDENTGKGSKSFHFQPQLTGNGDYLIYSRWTSGSNRASNVPVDILDSHEITWPVMVNQRAGGGLWNLIGGYSLSVANAEVALFNAGTDGYVIADSMKFVPAAGDASAIIVDNSNTAATLSTGTWTASSSTPGYTGSNYLHDGNTGKGAKTFTYKPVIPAVGDYLVYGRWTSDSNRANNVPVDVVRSDGVLETVTMDQTKNGGKWVLLGGWALSPSNAEIKIRTDGTSGYVVADSVRVLPSQEAVPSTITMDNTDASGVTITGSWTAAAGIGGFYGANYIHDDNTGKGSKSVRFAPNLPLAGNYEVFVRWTSGTNRASNVPIAIAWSGGTQSVTVDQRSNGGAWISLGSHYFNAGSTGNVLVGTTGTDGYVIADAVRFVKQP